MKLRKKNKIEFFVILQKTSIAKIDFNMETAIKKYVISKKTSFT